MNIKSFLVVAVISGVFGISCSGNDQEAVDKSLKQEAATTTTNSAVINDSATLQNVNTVSTQNLAVPSNPAQPIIQPSVQPGGNQVITQQIKPQAAAQPVATKTAAGMNPPHGQPGHRCEIEVGKPLNSAPKTAEPVKIQQTGTNVPIPNNSTTITPSVKPPSTTSPAGTSTGKLNPAHGQPGHKCEIAVGAPLN